MYNHLGVNASLHPFLLEPPTREMLETGGYDEFTMFLVHGDNLQNKSRQNSPDWHIHHSFYLKKKNSTYVVNPQDSEIQRGALILLEELLVHIHDVVRFGALHHAK